MRTKLLRDVVPIAAAAVFAIALYALHHALRAVHPAEILSNLRATPPERLALSLLLAAGGYLALTGYDFLAFRYIGRPMPLRKILFASFVGYALSNNVGMAGLAGHSIRFRLYSAWDLSTSEIARIVGFCAGAFYFGVLFAAGVAFTVEPLPIPAALHLPLETARPVGVLFLGVVLAAFVFSALRREPVRVRDWEIDMPSPRLLAAQALVSCLDWGLAAGALYALLPHAPDLSFGRFVGFFLLAQTLALASHVPGGVGVFESLLTLLLKPYAPAAAALGALLAFRALYYLFPLLAAAALLGLYELRRAREEVRRVARAAARWATGPVVPQVLALTTFLGGALLLFSGATPPAAGRMHWVRDVLPLPTIELSHFLGSLAGMGLLLLSRGIQRRLDAAYALSVLLLAAGAVLSVLKGADYEEAAVLTVMLAALLPCRRYFRRKARILDEPLSPAWLGAAAVVFGASVWLILFSYKHVEYAGDLWWRFALDASAPRSLRAAVGAFAVALVVAGRIFLRPAAAAPEEPGAEDLARAKAVVSASGGATANLALLGDKQLLFAESGDAFLMYGVQGRSWIAMGDPVGPEAEGEELAWRFRELCDRRDGWTVFYEARPERLPLYLDLGLSALKLGESGRVPLADFSLEGPARKHLRQAVHKAEREGCAFEVAPPEAVPALLPALRAISDRWLGDKQVREKRFSLGRFDEAYLRNFPVALVRAGGRPVAFANLWRGAGRAELSVDLMRYGEDAPAGVMDYLFTRLMLWGRDEGYRVFDLGMAPLSGLEDRMLAPLWSRLGALLFRHGENFYNFQGLRRYKEKFDPVWEPRYLASPGGLALPRILADAAALVSGGARGVIAR